MVILNYEQSIFDAPRPLLDDDAELERVWNRQYSLKEFITASNYKTYDQLKARLDEILAEDPAYLEFTGSPGTRAPQTQTTRSFSESTLKAGSPAKRVTAEDNDRPTFDVDVDDDDDDLKSSRALL
jgi:hypothetical protein